MEKKLQAPQIGFEPISYILEGWCMIRHAAAARDLPVCASLRGMGGVGGVGFIRSLDLLHP